MSLNCNGLYVFGLDMHPCRGFSHFLFWLASFSRVCKSCQYSIFRSVAIVEASIYGFEGANTISGPDCNLIHTRKAGSRDRRLPMYKEPAICALLLAASLVTFTGCNPQQTNQQAP